MVIYWEFDSMVCDFAQVHGLRHFIYTDRQQNGSIYFESTLQKSISVLI